MSSALDNLHVIVKLKPLSSPQSFLKVAANQLAVIDQESDPHEANSSMKFDAVLSEISDQQNLYEVYVKPMISSMLESRNACVMCFGPSGSGKSYSMRGGRDSQRGLLLRSIEYLLALMENSRENFELFVQVYLVKQERIIDLLSDRKTLSDFKLERVSDIMPVLKASLRKRKGFSQKQIKDISHFCIRLVLMNGADIVSIGDFVEIAGSDYAAKDPSIGKALNALKNVLTNQERHWQDSVFTEQLKPTLDIFNPANPSKVLMIVTAAQDIEAKGHSLSALKYAAWIKACLIRESSKKQMVLLEEFDAIQKEILTTDRCPTPDLGHWVDSRDRILNRLQEQLPRNYKENCGQLRHRLHDMQAHWETERHKQEFDESLEYVEELNMKVKQLEEDLHQSQLNVEELEEERLRLSTALENKDSELMIQRKRNDEMCKAQSRQEAKIAQLKAELAEALQESRDLQDKVAEFEERKIKREADISRDKEEMLSEIAKAHRELSHEAGVQKDLSRELGEAKVQVLESKAEINRLKGNCSVYEEKLNHLKSEIDSLRAQLASSQDSSKQLDQARKQLSAQQAEVSVMESKLAHEVEKAHEQQKLHLYESSLWKEERSKMQNSIAILESELDQTSLDLRDAKKCFEEEKRDYEDRERQLMHKVSMKVDIQPSLARITTAFDQLTELLKQPSPGYEEIMMFSC
mmetsp:Transcript_14217/g.26828  ORF Transcript_14217/g.26828 Transcript_14217/m.26828 type:complete len:693 (-) Transcript_14217:70-2148(-)